MHGDLEEHEPGGRERRHPDHVVCEALAGDRVLHGGRRDEEDREHLADAQEAARGKGGGRLLRSALVLYVARRWWRRRAFIKQLRMDQVSVDELRELMTQEKVGAILDVRSKMLQEASGRIPGARTIDMSNIATGIEIGRAHV